MNRLRDCQHLHTFTITDSWHGIHTPILDGQTTCIEVDGPPADRPAVLGGLGFQAWWQVALVKKLGYKFTKFPMES